MSEESTASALDERIENALAPFPEVTTAYIFGSRARGTARPDSDLDIAVSLSDQLPTTKYGALTLDIVAALEKLGPRVDLLDLARSSSTLGFRVIREGRCVVSRNLIHRTKLEATIARRYDDERPYRELIRRAARAAAIRMGETGR